MSYRKLGPHRATIEGNQGEPKVSATEPIVVEIEAIRRSGAPSRVAHPKEMSWK